MMAITDFPRCAAYLKGMGVKYDADMEEKHYAWLLGDAAFSEDELVRMGAAGLDILRWGELLPLMEVRFGQRTRKPKASKEARNKLLGMMCWCGLKGSTFKADSDIVMVASILWPKSIKDADMGLEDAARLIGSLPKKARSYSVRENLHRVPRKFFDDTTKAEGSAA